MSKKQETIDHIDRQLRYLRTFGERDTVTTKSALDTMWYLRTLVAEIEEKESA